MGCTHWNLRVSTYTMYARPQMSTSVTQWYGVWRLWVSICGVWRLWVSICVKLRIVHGDYKWVRASRKYYHWMHEYWMKDYNPVLENFRVSKFCLTNVWISATKKFLNWAVIYIWITYFNCAVIYNKITPINHAIYLYTYK